MIVLSPGTKIWTKVIECTKCGAHLLITQNDLVERAALQELHFATRHKQTWRKLRYPGKSKFLVACAFCHAALLEAGPAK